MIRIPRPILPFALGALLLAGCESPLTPTDVAGTYVLERVGSSPLPAPIVATDNFTITLVTDTLRLKTDETGSEVRRQEVSSNAGDAPAHLERSDVPLVYRTRAGGIELSYLCPPDAVCLDVFVAPIVGTRTDTGLVLHGVEGKDLVFRRIE